MDPFKPTTYTIYGIGNKIIVDEKLDHYKEKFNKLLILYKLVLYVGNIYLSPTPTFLYSYYLKLIKRHIVNILYTNKY